MDRTADRHCRHGGGRKSPKGGHGGAHAFARTSRDITALDVVGLDDMILTRPRSVGMGRPLFRSGGRGRLQSYRGRVFACSTRSSATLRLSPIRFVPPDASR